MPSRQPYTRATTQGSRVTTHVYDRYGRDTLVTDVAGSWRYRYDAVRGVLDSAVTPFGDTLRWEFDERWRAKGPYIGNGSNPDYSIVPAWDSTGKLRTVTTTHSVSVGLSSLPSDGEPFSPRANLLPAWSETQGSGGPTVTAADSLRHLATTLDENLYPPPDVTYDGECEWCSWEGGGGDGWGTFESWADRAVAFNTRVWAYEDYRANATHLASQLDPELRGKFHAMDFEQWNKATMYLEQTLSTNGADGWRSVYAGVSDIMNFGHVLVPMRDGQFQKSLHFLDPDMGEPDAYAGADHWTGFTILNGTHYPVSRPRRIGA